MRVTEMSRRQAGILAPTLVARLGSVDVKAYEDALAALERQPGRRLPATVSRQLASRIEHGRGWIRQRTVIALACIGADRYTLPALSRVLQSGSAAERDYACEAIMNGRQVRALPAIKVALADRDDQVRASALKALAALSSRTPDQAIRRAFGDTSRLVRLVAAKIVAGLKQRDPAKKNLLSATRDHLRRERDALVRAEILDSLHRVGRASEDLAQLLYLLGSRRGIVRWRVTESLAGVDTRRSAQAVHDALDRASHTEVGPRLRKRMRELLPVKRPMKQ